MTDTVFGMPFDGFIAGIDAGRPGVSGFYGSIFSKGCLRKRFSGIRDQFQKLWKVLGTDPLRTKN
jgi:hypothetical protein